MYELLHIIDFNKLNNKTINLIHLCSDNDSINVIQYYTKKYSTNKINIEIFNTKKNCIKCTIKKSKILK